LSCAIADNDSALAAINVAAMMVIRIVNSLFIPNEE